MAKPKRPPIKARVGYLSEDDEPNKPAMTIAIGFDDLGDDILQKLAEYILDENEMEIYLGGDSIEAIFDWTDFEKSWSLVSLAKKINKDIEEALHDEERENLIEGKILSIKALQDAINVLKGG